MKRNTRATTYNPDGTVANPYTARDYNRARAEYLDDRPMWRDLVRPYAFITLAVVVAVCAARLA